MNIQGLRMPPFNTTLMGVLRGVLDYYHIEATDAMLYGGSGHAFLINIHEYLCPSGPYCWNPEDFHRLARNLGIKMTDHGFFSQESSKQEREDLEALLIDHLDRQVPCSLLNMENQLVTGYDETGFITSQPWPHMDFPPKHLTFGSWEELGEEIHINFYTFSERKPASDRTAIQDSLEYAVDLFKNPSAHTQEPYGVGPEAYAKWVGAIERGEGSSHGNWWNATVWAECRARAADYFGEIAENLPETASLAGEIGSAYATIATDLEMASDKEMASGEKIALVEQIRTKEQEVISRIQQLIPVLG